LIDTVVHLVGSSGLLSIHVLFFVQIACFRNIFLGNDWSTNSYNNYKDDERNDDENKGRLHIHVWTKLMSNVNVVLFTVGFCKDLVAGNALLGLELGLEDVGGAIS